jgi:hypothetical protein
MKDESWIFLNEGAGVATVEAGDTPEGTQCVQRGAGKERNAAAALSRVWLMETSAMNTKKKICDSRRGQTRRR